MEFHTIFSNFVAIEQLDLDNEALKHYCKKTVTPSGNFINLQDPEIQPLLTLVTQRMYEIRNIFGLIKESYLEIDRGWINISADRSISEPHIHPRQFLVAVYYVSGTASSGGLVLSNPNPHHDQIIPACTNDGRNIVATHNQFNSSRYLVDPAPGKLVIFPGWLQHYVTLGDGSERISIALDSTLLNKIPQ